MRLSPKGWFLISLLLFAAAALFWQLGENQKAAHRATSTNAPSAQVVSPQARPPLPALTHPSSLAAPAVTRTNRYRLSNTAQTLAQLERNDNAVLLRNAFIDTTKSLDLQIPEQLKAKEEPGSYVVQSRQPLNQAFYALIRQAGAQFVSYIPNNAALVSATADTASQLRGNSMIQSVLPYEPYYKLDPSLLALAVEDMPLGTNDMLGISGFPNGRDSLLKLLKDSGAEVITEDRGPFGPFFVVRPNENTKNILATLAQSREVQEIERSFKRSVLNDLSRPILGVATNTVDPANYQDLNGENIWISINDTGVEATHPDLAGRVFASDIAPDWLLWDTNYDSSSMGHGTHVAGIIAGDGTQSTTVTEARGSIVPGVAGQFRGKASKAKLYVQPIDGPAPFDSDAYLQEAAAMTNSLVSSNATLISNNSWGYVGLYGYGTPAASFDAATRDAVPGKPGSQSVLYVFAAGNDGNGDDNGLGGAADSITSPAAGKNVITVGALECNRNITNEVVRDGKTNAAWAGMTDSSTLVASYSSRGNVGIGIEGEFGRFKPDVVAPGTFIVSTRSSSFIDPDTCYNEDVKYTLNQFVKPDNTNYYSVYVPADGIQLGIFVVPNSKSATPFPDFPIVADLNYPPTQSRGVNGVDFSVTQGTWNFGIVSPGGTRPASYDVVSIVLRTNDVGNYFQVLSNLNARLGPFYRYESGTSMAAPAVSGVLGLIQEFLVKKGIQPSPALLKALLINGAQVPDELYDFQVKRSEANQQGWGLPNISRSIPTTMTAPNSGPVQFVDQDATNALATGQSHTRLVQLLTPESHDTPLRVTLVWTDPPGNPAASIKLVNDLDLIVTNLDTGAVYVGNNFSGGQIYTTKTTNSAGSDVINNVENVYLNPYLQPLSTNYSITVRGARVNVNAVTANPDGIVQDYALVISSITTTSASPFTVSATPTITADNIPWVTSLTNGIPALYQRVGATSPLMISTNGATNQWRFYVFTNTVAVTNVNATNVVFVTFLPPNLSIPRNTDADIDLYVSKNLPGLTNLDPAVIASTETHKSLLRGGSEFVYFTNSVGNDIFYVGIKSEDQQGAEFGLMGIATDKPLGQRNPDGSVDILGLALPQAIPDAAFANTYPLRIVAPFIGDVGPMMIRKVTVTNLIGHELMGDLTVDLEHSGVTVRLKNQSTHGTNYYQEAVYDDSDDNTHPGSVRSDGPGYNLRDFTGSAAGAWILTVTDNLMIHTGGVQSLTIHVDPKPPQENDFIVTIPGHAWYYDYVDIPTDATNLSITVSSDGSGSVGVYLRKDDYPTLSLSDTNINVLFPGGGTLNWPSPQLTDGWWYYGIYNNSDQPVTVHVVIKIERKMVPELTVTYTSTDTPTNLVADMVTQSSIFVPWNERVFSTQVGIRLNDPRASDLALTLTSPQGTRVLLFENRGRTNAQGLGLTVTNADNTTNIIYAVFTENTNYTTTPIKFALPPYGSTNDVVTGAITRATSFFDIVPAGEYTNGQTFDGWTVIGTNIWSPSQTATNHMISIVNDAGLANSGNNFLALGAGHLLRTNATIEGHPYRLTYAYRGPGIVDWWSGNGNPKDLIGTNHGTLCPPDGLINVVFGGSKTGLAATGISAADYWNPFNFAFTDTASIPLYNYNNTPSGATLTLQNGGGYWGTSGSGDSMYDSYVYPNGNLGDGVGPMTVTITNMPPGMYDFYLYGHAQPSGCPNETDSIFQLVSGTASYGPLGTASNTTWNVTQGWREGQQYILFRDVPVFTNVPVTITVVAGLDGVFQSGYCWKAMLNGIQIVDSKSRYAAGKVERAFTFDGTNYVQIPHNQSLNVTGVFSIDAWINVEKVAPEASTIYAKWAGSDYPGGPTYYQNWRCYMLAVLPNNGLRFSIAGPSVAQQWDGAFDHYDTPANVITTNQWAHVAATYDGAGTRRVYVNGVLVGQRMDAHITLATSLADAAIGAFIDNGTGARGTAFNPFFGRIDEVSFYNRALSPAEIYGIYKADSQGKFTANSPMPSAQVIVDGMPSLVMGNGTNWLTNTYVFYAASNSTTIELEGNPLGMLFDTFKLEELPSNSYGNYYLPEESLDIFKGELAKGDWTLQAWDTRTWQPTNANLVSWDLQLKFSSTNVNLIVLTNHVQYTNSVDPNSFAYFGFDVPEDANYATNFLNNFTGGGLYLWFNQTELPTGNLPDDEILMAGVNATGMQVIGSNTTQPLLIPGQRYYLGLYNASSTTPQHYGIQIDTDGGTNFPATPLTNSILLTTNVTTIGSMQYYYYDVSTNATAVSFEVIRPSSDVDLLVHKGLPPPGPLNFNYMSANSGIDSESVLVLTNSTPVPVSPGRWYLAVTAASQAVTYSILATEFTATNPLIVLTNSVPYTNTIPGGAPMVVMGAHQIESTVSAVSANSIQYFLVDVPEQAFSATHTLQSLTGGRLSLLFNQTLLPTGSSPGDYTLINDLVGGTNTITADGIPPLQPGFTYLLGVVNATQVAQDFTLKVTFGLAPNIPVIPLTNTIAYSNSIPNTNGLQYYSFDVPDKTGWIAFEIINPTGDVNLSVRSALPLPDFHNVCYSSTNGGKTNEAIVVLTNSEPMAVSQGRWYLAVTNTTNTTVSYKIRATAWSLTNTVITLTNQVVYTNLVATNTIQYFLVDVPTNVIGVKNTLISTNALKPLSLIFNQTVMPLGTMPGDYTFITNSATTNSYTLRTNTTPPLMPGLTYYLGVANTNAVPTDYSVQVDFIYNITPLTNAIVYTNTISATNAPQYYSFVVSNNAERAAFEVLSPSADVTLAAKLGSLPDLLNGDYLSANPGTNNESIIVLTNSLPVNLTPGTWYLSVYNVAGTGNITYKIRASEWDSTTNLVVVTDGGVTNGVIEGNSYRYFAIDVPSDVVAATNTLSSSDAVDLLYSRIGLPTGTLPGDFTLLTNVVNGSSILRTNGTLPLLEPGYRYFLGIHNTNSVARTFSLKVDFAHSVTPLTNGIVFASSIASTNAIQYYSFDVTANAAMVSFEILNPSGDVNLLARRTWPLPNLGNYDYASTNPGTNSEFIVITNTLELTPGQWLLGVYSVAGTNNITYNIRASEFDGQIAITPLINGVSYADSLPPSDVRHFYSFDVSTNATLVSFEVLHPSDYVDMVVRRSLPLPDYLNGDYFSYNQYPLDQSIVISTNSSPAPLAPGRWYVGVYSPPGAFTADYEIRATETTNGPTRIELKNGIPYTNAVAGPGVAFGTNHQFVFYQFTISNSAPGVVFTMVNLANNVSLIVRKDNYPSLSAYDYGSFMPDLKQVLLVGTNLNQPSLNGTWYLAVPNMTGADVTFDIAATLLGSNGYPGPIIYPATISSRTNGFGFSWSSIPGLEYQIDVSTNLPTFNFLTNITSTSTNTSFINLTPVKDVPYQFYRVLQLFP